ncbi:MAG: CAP domain-containing protein [Pseudomonadota bacterium]
MTPALPDVPVVEAQIIALTNEVRAEQSLAPVRRNSQLDQAAIDYARLLAATNQFAHDADGRGPEDRAQDAGYTYCQIAENLALHLNSRGFSSNGLAELAMEGWLNSPGHRRNLLQPHVTEIGMAVVRAPDKHPKYISVQLFGRPQSEAYSFQVSNSSATTITYAYGGETHDVKPGFAVRHSDCVPNTLEFTGARKSGREVRLKSRFAASDGRVYVVKGQSTGAVSVSVEQKRTLSRNRINRQSATTSKRPSANAVPPLPVRP